MSRPRLRTPAENKVWRAFVRASWEKATLHAGRCIGCGHKRSRRHQRCADCLRKHAAHERARYKAEKRAAA